MVATLLLRQLGIFFLYMAAGAGLVKSGVCEEKDSKVMSLLVVYLLLPCAIIKSFQVDISPELRHAFILVFIIGMAAQLIMMGVAYAISAVYPLSPIEKGSIMYPNSANLILPLVAGVLGEDYMIYACVYTSIQGLFLWTHCNSMMKGVTELNWRKVLLNLNLITVVVGTCMFFAQIRLPGVIYDTLAGLSSALGPISMILIGMVLTSVDWKNLFANKRVYLVVALRMLVLPIIAIAIFKYTPLHGLMPNGKMILLVLLLQIMAPVATLITSMAQLYDQDDRYAAAINALSTVLCIVTMPLLTMWYMR